MNKVKYLFLAMRPPLLVLGFLAPTALILWVGEASIEGLLVILAVGFYNACANLMNEWQDRFDDIKKRGKTPPAIHLSQSMVYPLVSILLIISLFFIAVLATMFNWVYGLIGVVGISGGIIYNVLRRKDLLGNIVLGTTYGCACLMATYPEWLFPVAFGLFTIAHNSCVQVQDLGHETIETLPSQVGRGGALSISIILGVVSSCIFTLEKLYLFSVVPVLVVLGSLVYVFIRQERVFEMVMRIGARVMLFVCFLVMLIKNI